MMIQITADRVTPALRSLFRTDDMQAGRCFAILAGIDTTGKIMTDNPTDPTWAIVQEAHDGCTFLGGHIEIETFANVFAVLRQEGEVLFGLRQDDPRLQLLPLDPDYDGRTLEFYDRPI